VKIRRLNPVGDESLLRQAFEWDAKAPAWYMDSDAICRPSLDVYLKMTHDENQVDIGVFDEDEMIGLVTFDHKINGVAEVRLSAKRGASLELLIEAAYQLRHQFFSLGMTAGVVWIAKRNRQIVKLCEVIGFVREGSMRRGTYHRPKGDRPIEWLRLITTREQWLSEQEIAA
jgi:RimJ/RimL family protein N-acetyltransferase